MYNLNLIVTILLAISTNTYKIAGLLIYDLNYRSKTTQNLVLSVSREKFNLMKLERPIKYKGLKTIQSLNPYPKASYCDP